jgi:UDP-N-acetylglucosamine 1-carboxyvinyltransferase
LEKIVVHGGKALTGILDSDGAKNAVLPIMAALILNESEEDIIIENVPDIKDVKSMCSILSSLGVKITDRGGGEVVFNASALSRSSIPPRLTKEMRSSIFIMGPLLARLGKVHMSGPGGCAIGSRPIDLHLKGLRALGAEIDETEEYITAVSPALRGATIHLDLPSVGATENVMMAAVGAQGETIINNAAKEPEIVDLQNFLNYIGADIRGAGTSRIRIKGPTPLRGGRYKVIPDRIVTGTMMIAAGITGGDILLKNVIPRHVKAITAKLREAGMFIEEGENWLRAKAGPMRSVEKVSTQAYPGYPTDLQAPIMSLLALAEGRSTIYEEIFENRLKHVQELRKMGANITPRGNRAEIAGVKKLLPGKVVEATDLRAGAALVLAALAVDGKTEILNPHHIDRGYDKLEEKLVSLGGEIYRVREG